MSYRVDAGKHQTVSYYQSDLSNYYWNILYQHLQFPDLQEESVPSKHFSFYVLLQAVNGSLKKKMYERQHICWKANLCQQKTFKKQSYKQHKIFVIH